MQRQSIAHSLHITSKSEAETRQFGTTLGRLLRPGDVVLLHGDLGSGKTTLTQGIAKGLGIEDYVQSPTFTLVAEHPGQSKTGNPLTLYHLDLYRLDDPSELESFGYEDLVTQSDGVVVVEWPERAGGILPDDYVLIVIEASGPDERQLSIQTIPAEGSSRELLDGLRDTIGGG
jgi:tRNA threonylcarbamoyladenosine biosynthesis protein TsaE